MSSRAALIVSSPSITESRSLRADSTRWPAIRRWSRPTWAATLRRWRDRDDLAQPRACDHLLRPDADTRADLTQGRDGRAGLPARRQRIGQVDDAEDDTWHRPAAGRPGAARRSGRVRLAGTAAHRQGHRDRARKSPAV